MLALEDILRTDGLAAVIVEYDGISQSADYWMRLARRAQLAAEASGVTGFLLGWLVAANRFETQWRVAPAAMDWTNMDRTNMDRHPLPRWRWPSPGIRPSPGIPVGCGTDTCPWGAAAGSASAMGRGCKQAA